MDGRSKMCLRYAVLGTAVFASLAMAAGCASTSSAAQRGDPKYPSIAMGRARAAVSRAQIPEQDKAARLQKRVGEFYIAIYNNHQARDAEIEQIRARSHAEATADRDKLLRDMQREGATPEQIATIQDGMTHGGYFKLLRQYEGYQPPLSSSQLREVRRLLAEARDESMMAGSATEKIDIFNIEYRAKINAYLMTQGYDIATAKKAYDEKITESAATQPVTPTPE